MPLFYSEHEQDFRVGDTVRDRQSGQIGIIQRIENTLWTGGNIALFIYLVKQGYVKKYAPETVVVLKRAVQESKVLVSKALRTPHPDSPRPSVS